MRVWDMSLLKDDPLAARQQAEAINNYVYSEESRQQMGQRFTKLQRQLTLGLILGFLLPNLLLAFYFRHQFTHTLKSGAAQSLEAIADHRRAALDLYLRERIDNLLALPEATLAQGDLAEALATLRRLDSGFVAAAWISPAGQILSFAGPPGEVPKPSGLAPLFAPQTLSNLFAQAGGPSHACGASFFGPNQSERFAIAVRPQAQNDSTLLLAILDLQRVRDLLGPINRAGNVHLRLLTTERELAEAPLSLPPAGQEAASVERTLDDVEIFAAGVRLVEAPWALVAQQGLASALTALQRPSRVLMYTLLVMALSSALAIFLAVRHLMARARRLIEKGSRLQEMLAHASKMASIGELAAGVAHEINNPLAIIMAESGVIRDMFNPEFGMDHSQEALYKELEVIDNAATRAKGITKRLQEMGKARVPQSEPCDINQQVETVIARLRKLELKNRKGIEILQQQDPELPLILAESAPMRQVIANLLLNAADAIDTDRGLITIATGMEEGKIAITVSDSGRGIPADNLERIFHPFYTTKGGAYGTGLGLSIAASIVKYLGGIIKVTSTVGKGSTFTVLLPNNFSCPIPPKTTKKTA